jgi:pyridoxamine 5'-phosphate oxidase
MTAADAVPGQDALGLLQALYREACALEAMDATAAALATVDASGAPSVRMVLVKDVDPRGLLFFTNEGSRKAADLRANPRAALCFHWPAMQSQVRAEGTVAPAAAGESDRYFASRPRESQLAAWASRQSETLPSRDELMAAYSAAAARFAGRPVDRPPFWGGFRLEPRRLEFWRAGDHRLHHRREYTLVTTGWESRLLFP